MPIKAKKVLLSFIPGRVVKLRAYGAEHRMHTTQGGLKNGTICMKIINFMLDVRADADIQKFLKDNGGSFHDLVLRALKKYIAEKKY